MNLNTPNLIDAVKKHGTPLYIYDGQQLISNYHHLKDALPGFVDVFYALKVNPNLSLVKLLRSQGACTEVCSLAEMEIALKAGSSPEDIIFLGPCKKEEELRKAISLGIYALVIESETELERVSRLAKELDQQVHVAIRINPDFSADGSPWKMGGRPTHFGIEESQAIANFSRYLATPNIKVRGIHVYNGTNILDAKSVFDNTKYILNLFDQISTRYSCDFSMVDVGGGMGVPYFPNQEQLDIQTFHNLMYPLFSDFNRKYPNTRIIMESGRFIQGTAGALAVQVNNLKTNHGKTFAVTDGGTNCHSAASGTGRVVKRNFPIENISANDEDTTNVYQVSGPLCSPDDIIGRNVELKEINVLDILLVKMSGAYGPTASPVLFHSHGYPAEVLIHQGEVKLIRERDSVADIINKHVELDFSPNELLAH